MKLLTSRITVGALGDGNDTDVADPEIIHHLEHRTQLPLAAVNQQQVGPVAARPVGIFLQGTLEPAPDHLAHHRKIVATGDGLDAILPDVELAIGRLVEAFGAGDDHPADGMTTLNVRIVVDLDAFRCGFKLEQFANFAKKAALRAGVGKIARQRLLGIMHRHGGEFAPRATLWTADFHPAAGTHGQCLAKQILLFGFVRQQNFGRRVLVVVELPEKGRQNGGGRRSALWVRK